MSPVPKLLKDPRLALCVLVPLLAVTLATWTFRKRASAATTSAAQGSGIQYLPRQDTDTSGLGTVQNSVPAWPERAPLAEVARFWKNAGFTQAAQADAALARTDLTTDQRVSTLMLKARCLLYEGEADRTLAVLANARAVAMSTPESAAKHLYTVIYYQGVAALRLAETVNCVRCRGVSACIIPLAKSAVHQDPRGSRMAVRFFREYVRQFPDDLAVLWLLNLAHATLGEELSQTDPQYFMPLDRFANSEFDIGRFRDVSHEVGLERENEAGAGIMDDFDNDGLLDVMVTSFDPTQPMGYFRNLGDGRFREQTRAAGLSGELGGLNAVQGDYNNDGLLDLYILRGAWLEHPIRPSLLRNNGDGTFTNVTEAAGLLDPQNANAAAWADYDNDGYLDLVVGREHQLNRLYHNLRNGRFEEVAAKAGLTTIREIFCKGVTWIDYDRDDYPDLFFNYMDGTAHLFRNNRKGRFTDVSREMGIDGPEEGFSCWAFDYDNDGWQDLFATCYQRTVTSILKGMVGMPHSLQNNRLFRNMNGTRFEDATRAAGLDKVFSTMGSNFGDFDNDGYLDMYLATGEPAFGSLVPNRMLRNVGGTRFADISGTSGTAHLQKGHGVACGDWDRDGDVDLFVELGGAAPGDRYHNVMFQNPGQKNRSLTVKLVGRKTNRLAIGARIKAVTTGPNPQTLYRWVSSGSSFGGNPLQQTLGLGTADRVATLEVHWPTSGTTQTFYNLPAGQAIEVTEFAKAVKPLTWRPLTSPKGAASAP